MLTDIERWQHYSVEGQRAEYSDADLWEWLMRMKKRETELLQLVGIAYRHAHSWRRDRKLWLKRWNSVVDELNTNQPMIDLLIRHLTKRGDATIVDWVSRHSALQRQLAARADIVGWKQANE